MLDSPSGVKCSTHLGSSTCVRGKGLFGDHSCEVPSRLAIFLPPSALLQQESCPDTGLQGLLSIPLYLSFKVRGGADPEIDMTAQLLCFIRDIDVKEDSIKNGL